MSVKLCCKQKSLKKYLATFPANLLPVCRELFVIQKFKHAKICAATNSFYSPNRLFMRLDL